MRILKSRKKPVEAEADTKAKGVNPYLNARRAWNDHVAGIAASRQTWQFVAMSCLLIALSAIGGIVYIGSQSKFVPYIVEVDKLGEAVGVHPAEVAQPVPSRVVQAYVAEFINDARMVTPDVSLQREAILDVYSMLRSGDPASQEMGAWLRSTAGNPFKRAANEMVTTKIRSVLPVSTSSWQVDWIETTSTRKGVVESSVHMRAIVTVKIVPPAAGASEEEVSKNPLGIYVTNFTWTKEGY